MKTLDEEIRKALEFANSEDLPPAARAEMLMQIAMRVQMHARSPTDLESAVDLYDLAQQVCPDDQPLLAARIRARTGTALQQLPDVSGELLPRALELFDEVLPRFEADGESAELAELHMNRGLAMQSLAVTGRARMPDAIRAYQEALRFFDGEHHPREFAILHNNLATAFLSLRSGDPGGRMREALAVQSFEEALAVITLEEHPLEYAMLQNNLGNALQQVDSGHREENRRRAISAYDEALRVRNQDNMPLQYATTLANRAECLAALAIASDDPAALGAEALRDFMRALGIFRAHGDHERERLVGDAVAALEADGHRPEPADSTGRK